MQPPAPEQSGPLELEPSADETMSTGDGGEEQREPDVDIVGEVNDEEDDDDEVCKNNLMVLRRFSGNFYFE